MTRFVSGFRVDADFPIAGLSASGSSILGRVSIERDRERPADPFSAVWSDAHLYGRRLSVRIAGEVQLHIEGVAAFHLHLDGSRIRYTPAPGVSADLFQDCVLDFVLPLHMSLAGRVRFLHGGAVDAGGAAIGFLAPSGTGKSTLVAHFVKAGHPFVTDDKLGIGERGGFAALPGAPSYRLDDGAGERRWPVTNVATELLPLRALYVLAPVDPNAPATIARLTPGEAIAELNRSFVAHLSCGLEQQVRATAGMHERFHWWASLASSVRVSRLTVPRMLTRLPEVRDRVLRDVDAGSASRC